MIKKKLLLAAIFTVCTSLLYAQTQHGTSTEEPSQSANASKGSGGGNMVNVDLFTGTASVNVPIHSFSVEGMNAGISLSYMAKGIKVDEVASSVGLGWQLNAGGSITREVNGIEDEVTLGAFFKQGAVTHPQHDSNTFDYLQGFLAPNAVTTGAYGSVNVDDTEPDLFRVNMLGRSLSFCMKKDPSNAQKLIFQTKPYSEVKIELTSEDWDAGFSQLQSSEHYISNPKGGVNFHTNVIKFKITDEKGNEFYFDRGDCETKQYEVGGQIYHNNTGTYYAAQKWDLTKVVTVSGLEIVYVYEGASILSQLVNITETFHEGKWEDINTSNWTVVFDPLEIKNHTWSGVKTHLKEIHYPNGTKVYFNIDNTSTSSDKARLDYPGDWIVKDIKVEHAYSSGVSNAITYKLNHAFFHSPAYGYNVNEVAYDTDPASVTDSITFPNTGSRTKHHAFGLRLKLKGIERIGFDDATTEPYYTFQYNQTPLPYRFSAHKDYYGYYNGKNSTPYIRWNFFWPHLGSPHPQYDTFYLSIPFHTDPHNTYVVNTTTVSTSWGLDRSYNADSAQACVLTKITNSYGGYEDLHYKNYTLSNPSCSYGFQTFQVCTGGGVQIGCVIDPDLEGDTVNDGLCIDYIDYRNAINGQHYIRTEYTLSNGQRINRGGYTWYKGYDNYIVRTNNFVHPNFYYNGSNHGFSTVRVKQKGWGLQTTISDNEYHFSNLMFNDPNYQHNNNLNSNMFKPTGMGYRTMSGHLDAHKMGLLLEKKEFDQNSTLISKQVNTYTEVENQNITPILQTRYFNGSCHTKTLSFSHDIIDSKRMLLTRQQFYRNLNVLGQSYSNDITISYDYTYDEHDNVKLITWYDSRGIQYKKYKRYNYDYFANFSSVPVLGNMNTRNLQYLLSQEAWMMLSGGTDSSLIDFSLSVPNPTTGFNGQFRGIFSLINGNPIPSGIISNVMNTTAPFLKVDNALNYTTNSFYGYHLLKRKEFTIMDIYGQDMEKRLNDQDIYTSSLRAGNGDKVAVAVNARFIDIAFTSFEVQKGRWNYDDNYVIQSTGTAMTGSHYFDLINGTSEITSSTLRNMDYIVAFWVESGVDPQAEVVNLSGTSPVTLTHQNTAGNWKLYTAEITPDSGGYFRLYNNESSESMHIDEIRLHPSGATFESYTYLPMCGVVSKNNNMNNITYMEYDLFGRLIITKDLRGNILSKLEQFAQHDDNSGGGSGCGTCGLNGGGNVN